MAHRKLSDAERWQAVGMVTGGMSYIKTAERFNVSHSVIVRLKQRVNQTGSKRTPKDRKTSESKKKARCKKYSPFQIWWSLTYGQVYILRYGYFVAVNQIVMTTVAFL
jgi:hypothetical protein